MIRFVDMRAAEIAGVRFGFWDTVRDCMLVVDGEQGWETVDELRLCQAPPDLVNRLVGLCPEWTGVRGLDDERVAVAHSALAALSGPERVQVLRHYMGSAKKALHQCT